MRKKKRVPSHQEAAPVRDPQAASKADHADTFIMERYEEELGKNIEIDAPELEEEVSLAGESHDMVSASEHQTESEMPEPALAAIL